MFQVSLGAYVLQDFGKENAVAEGGVLPHPSLILLATGTEVHLAVAAAQILLAEGAPGLPLWVRVASMPSCELFDKQELVYQRSVLLPGAPVMSIEASGVVSNLLTNEPLHCFSFLQINLNIFSLSVLSK